MKKILSFIMSLFVVLSSISGSFVVLASAEENLWKDISVSNFNTKDQSLNGDFGFEQYTDGTYGAAFHIKCAWYTSFYVAMPSLEPDTEYQISFRYNNSKTDTAGTIEKIHVLTENELEAVDENGKVTDNNATCIASNLPLDQEAWTLHSASFTTGSTQTNYYLNFKTGYAYWLQLCDLKIVKTSNDTDDNTDVDLNTTPMPNLLANISVDNFGSKDQSPTTTDFGFSAMTEGTYGTKYKITNCWYTSYYISLPELKPNTEYYLAFRYDNDVQVVTAGKLEAIHILNEEQLAAVNADGKVTDSSIAPIGQNIPLDKGGWSLFKAYFTTGNDTTNYYINIKTGYAYNMYLCDFVLKETVSRPVVVTGGTADKQTAKVGEEITITATPTSSQKFMGWENVVGDAALDDSLSPTTTFLMPDSAVSIKAEYYENLLKDIDTTYLGTNDESPNGAFKIEQYKDENHGTAFNVYGAWYTSFYIKLPAMEVNEEYNLSLWYDNHVIDDKPASISKIDLVTKEELESADANGSIPANTGKTLATNLTLDKNKWSGLHITFTPEEDTEYYINIKTNYAYLLKLTGFKLTKNFSLGMTITDGTADNPFALSGETVNLTANEYNDKTFGYWRVLSGGVTISNPYSANASFTMGEMAANIEAVYLNNGEVKTIYTSLDGTDFASPISDIHSSTVTDNGDGTATARINLYTYDGAYAFNGWYSGDALLSTATEYTFDTAETSIDSLTAKVLVLNTIDGDPGFENYSTGDTVRVDPANSEVAPYNDRWGIWSRYASAKYGFEAGYEKLDWSYIIKAYNGETTDYYKNYTYSPETATYSLDSVKTPYTVTPYSGNSMLGFAVKSRSAVRKLQNLMPNTEYQISFYVNNPTPTDLLKKIVVANSYDFDAGSVSSTDERVYAYFDDYDGYADYDKIRNWGRMTVTFTTPADVTEAWLHFVFSTTNSHSSESKVFIDNLICVPTVVSYAGNAIRKTSAELPQALRYKFFINNENLESFGGMQVNEIGLLAMNNEDLNGEELVIDGKYGNQNKSPRVGIINKDNIQYVEGDSTHSYFTAALYNIGRTDGAIDYNKFATDYTVRPYFKLNSADGKEIVLYSAAIDASVFSVIHEIYSAKNNQDDRLAADEIMSVKAAKDAFADFEPKGEFFIMKDAVTDYAFSIAVVGDPQKTAYFHPEDMHYTYDWIVANAEKNKTEYVITLGDLTEYSTEAEYELMKNELKKIQNAGIPQAIVRGNHDVRDDFDANITKAEFGSHLTGSYDDTMKNVYHILEMGGTKYMIMTLDYYDHLTSDMVDWAAGIVAANPDCRVILNTHGLLSTQMQTYSNAKVQYLHKNLIMKYENIDLVLCGHDIPFGDDGPVYKTITGDNGNKIVEMMINPQTLEEQKREAFGLVSTLYFGNDGKTVTVDWYSTIRNAYYMDKFQFTIELE